MSAFAVEEVLRPSSSMSCDGFWSGTEERQHQPYIAMIPESRYLDQSEIIDDILHEHFVEPKAYVPVSYPTRIEKPRIDLTQPAPFKPNYRQTQKQKSWNPPPFHTVRIGGIGLVPIHMSGLPDAQLFKWLSSSDGRAWRKRYPDA